MNKCHNSRTDPFTVQFSYSGGAKNVYWASSVNYALWGRMNALCNIAFGQESDEWSLDSALDTVALYKTRYLWSQLDDAEAFTRFGYENDSPLSAALTQDAYHVAQPNNVLRVNSMPYNWDGL